MPSSLGICQRTVGVAVRWGEWVLSESDGSGRADAMLLLAHALKDSRESLITHPEETLSEQQSAEFERLCERRRSGEPMAYILGSAGFYGREFFVDRSVLVPRPETEHLVEEAIRFIRARTQNHRRLDVLDVGVGSGAIACTIAGQTSGLVVGTDVSRDAIDLAIENARRLNVSARCRFVQGDLVEPALNQRFDVIIANLPYIPTADLPQPPDPTSFEPRCALDGGPDGLAHYRRLLPQVPRLLDTDGLLLLEAAPPTIGKLKELTLLSLPNFAISVGRDYAGLERYVRAGGAVVPARRYRHDGEEAPTDERSHGGRERGGRAAGAEPGWRSEERLRGSTSTICAITVR